jgi:hypothetical protein
MADMADLADLADVAGLPCMTATASSAAEVARCPRCGTIGGGTAAALDALYGEVARLRRIAERPPAGAEEALREAAAREAELLREIRLLQETVARLRGRIVT